MSKTLCLTFFGAAVLTGCSASIKYTPWSENDPPLQATSLKFALQDSSVLFAIHSKPDGDPAMAGGHVLGTEKPCPETQWWTCFDNVTPVAIMSLPESGKKMYVAQPSDARHLYLSSTSISGIPAAGQEGLYTQISIKYTNNTGAILSGAGAGAGVGASFGPGGVLVGALAGTVAAAKQPMQQMNAPYKPALGSVFRPKREISDFLCESEKMDLSNAQALTPSLYVPLTISGEEARPFAPDKTIEMWESKPKACWKFLPNSKYISQAFPVRNQTRSGPSPMKALGKGDGWLYRFVAENDVSEMPMGAHEKAEDYFGASKGARQDFPFSSCRKIEIQIVWWKELEEAISEADKTSLNTAPNPRVINFDLVVADPTWVSVAPMRKGGVINFKKSCGANISLSPDYSNNAFINSAITAAQKIRAAQEAAKTD